MKAYLVSNGPEESGPPALVFAADERTARRIFCQHVSWAEGFDFPCYIGAKAVRARDLDDLAGRLTRSLWRGEEGWVAAPDELERLGLRLGGDR